MFFNQILRSTFFYFGYLGSALLAGLFASTIGLFLPLKVRLKVFSLWPRFANWLLSKTCNIQFVVEGIENIPKEGCVIVSNHQGQWETFSMQYIFFPLSTLLKKELLFIPFWGWGLSLLNPIAINRSKPKEAILKTLEEGSKRLNEGMFVLFFPEGTRVRAGEVGKYARSAFELAKRSSSFVLPVVHNSGDCWPAHKFLKTDGCIKLIIGEPVLVKNAKQQANIVEEWTKKNLKEIRRLN
tara:strand:+ start:19432 stop:20151 length:720 start_codon:yes stop_codon:yes gene_type:complete